MSTQALNSQTVQSGMKKIQRAAARNLGSWWFICAVLLASILPAWGGPKEDGDTAFKAGKMAEAEVAYTLALTANPDDALSLIGRGRARQTLGKRADAAADFERAVQLAPGNSEAWVGHGLSHYYAKDYKTALADLDKAVALDPRSAKAVQDRGVVHDALKDYKAGVIDCTNALKIQPNYINAYNERGHAWQQLKDPESALRDFEEVIRLDPRNTYALTQRAIIYEANGEKEKAEREYRFVLALDPKQNDAVRHLAALQGASATVPALAQAAATKAPPAPSASLPATSVASPSALKPPPAKPQRGFKLASSVEYTFDKRSLDGCAADIDWTGDWQAGGGQCAVRWHWTVPQFLVPGNPAKVHIDGSVTGNASESACIALETTDANGDTKSLLLVASRLSNVPNYKFPTNAADDFEVTLPDPSRATQGPSAQSQGRGAKSVVKLRNDPELRHIAGDYDQGILADSPKTPNQIPIEDCLVDLGTGTSTSRELVLCVYAEGDLNRPLAQYTYRWTPEVGK